MYKGFMRYGWNKNNHKALCVPFIRQYSVVKGLRNYSLELRTTHYAHVYMYIVHYMQLLVRAHHTKWMLNLFLLFIDPPPPIMNNNNDDDDNNNNNNNDTNNDLIIIM